MPLMIVKKNIIIPHELFCCFSCISRLYKIHPCTLHIEYYFFLYQLIVSKLYLSQRRNLCHRPIDVILECEKTSFLLVHCRDWLLTNSYQFWQIPLARIASTKIPICIYEQMSNYFHHLKVKAERTSWMLMKSSVSSIYSFNWKCGRDQMFNFSNIYKRDHHRITAYWGQFVQCAINDHEISFQ